MPSINKRVHILIKAGIQWLAILNANISQQKNFTEFHLIWSFDRTKLNHGIETVYFAWNNQLTFCLFDI